MLILWRSLALVCLAALPAAGCAVVVTSVAPLEPVIAVEPAGRSLLLHSPSDRRRLSAFLWSAAGGRLDALHVTVVSTYPGLRRAVARTVRAFGVEAHKIREVHGVADAAGRFPVRVAAVRYHAHPPLCAPSLVTGPSANENDFDPFIGCSDLANLALQVNDPKDLLGNRARPPADGERAAIPVARYRAFGTGGTGGSGTSGAGTGATSAP